MELSGVDSGRPAVMDYKAAVTATARVSSPASVEVSYGEKNGLPAVFISDEDMTLLAKPFELTLIGKFLVDRPPLADIRKFIVMLKFFGFVKVDKHDMKNVVFRFSDERDYMRFFARRLYKVFGVDMRVAKWSPFADVSEELPIVPLWVSFPGLRYQLFHLKTLMDIAKVFGKPLCVDSNTASQGIMSQARVLVEVDVSKRHPDRIWLGSQENGAYQNIVIEKLPSFCSKCNKIGHAVDICQTESVQPARAMKWVPKSVSSLGVEGIQPLEHSILARECNHPGSVGEPNFSNYANYVKGCRAEEAGKLKGAVSSTPLTDLVNEVLGSGENPGGAGSYPSQQVAEVSHGADVELPQGEECVPDTTAQRETPGECLGSVSSPRGQAPESRALEDSKVRVVAKLGVSVEPILVESVVEVGSDPSGKLGNLDEAKSGMPEIPSSHLLDDSKTKPVLYSNVLKYGTTVTPVSPRKTRMQSKLKLGGQETDPDSWNLSTKNTGKCSGPRATALQALLYPHDS